MAKYYGFDGWFFNIESPLPSSNYATKMADFLRYLTEQTHKELGENSLVLWYDSILADGSLQWQNALNERNKCFFDACDGIFINYGWNEALLSSTYHLSRNEEANNDRESHPEKQSNLRNWDVYMGIDVWGRGTFGGGGYSCHNALRAIENLQEVHCYSSSKHNLAPSFN